MPNTYKTMGQAAPAANTDTVLYTVPASTQFIESTLSVCNRNIAGLTATFRVAVVPKGETLSNKHYVCFDQGLESRSTETLTLGLTLNAEDRIVVRGSTADLSFSLFGCEVS